MKGRENCIIRRRNDQNVIKSQSKIKFVPLCPDSLDPPSHKDTKRAQIRKIEVYCFGRELFSVWTHRMDLLLSSFQIGLSNPRDPINSPVT